MANINANKIRRIAFARVKFSDMPIPPSDRLNTLLDKNWDNMFFEKFNE
ncbi:hypothetical protein [Sphingobacterium sp.]